MAVDTAFLLYCLGSISVAIIWLGDQYGRSQQ